MTIHFFTRGDVRDAASRQRVFQIVDKLNERGIIATVHGPPAILLSTTPWPQKFSLILTLIRSLSLIRKGDVVYLQRIMVNKYFFVLVVLYLKIFRTKMIFDFCDPVYIVNPFKTKFLTRMADAVVVSSHVQVVWARQFNKNVHLIHISLDSSIYKKFMKKYPSTTGPLTIGWLGTASQHIFNLEILASVFRKLLATTDIPFRFLLIGAFNDRQVYEMFQRIPHLDVRFIDKLDYTDPESAPREIQTFDIGVVPQRNDSAWNKGKTSMKVLEYMACAVPTIVSAFGEMPYLIEDSINGYIAASEDEWVDKLTRLLRDPLLREKLGRAGQATIQERYSFDAILPQVVQVINSL